MDLGEDAVYAAGQDLCPCGCNFWATGQIDIATNEPTAAVAERGCYGPADWRRRPGLVLQDCYREVVGCRCWGGPDRECEGCWLASK